LRKIPITGGPPVTLHGFGVQLMQGATWGENGRAAAACDDVARSRRFRRRVRWHASLRAQWPRVVDSDPRVGYVYPGPPATSIHAL
jgi:hypothetical protein